MKITPNVPTSAFTLKARATWNVLFDDNNKAVAIFSTKSRLADVAIMAPEMYELLERAGEIMNELESLIDNTFTNDASAQKSQWLKDADALLAKIEGGDE